MLSPMFNIILIPLLIAMFLAVNMGGSGIAPAFSAAYDANLIRKDIKPTLLVQLNTGAILALLFTIIADGLGILHY